MSFMQSKGKRWEEFERLVAAIHGAIDPAAQVTWNDSINGRQFDVTIRFRKGLYDYLTVIECKDYSIAVPVEKVEAFVTKARDANAHQAVMASSSGFQSGAEAVGKRHNVVLINLTDSPEIDLSTFGAEWGPNVNALHVKGIELEYRDGQRKNLPEAANVMGYYVNHMAVKTPSKTIPLHDMISEKVQSFSSAQHDVYGECKIMLPNSATLVAPDDREFPSKPLACIVVRVAMTSVKTYIGPRLFDPALLVADVNVQNVSTRESKTVSRRGLPLGTAEKFEVGTFYEQPQLSHYFYCDQIENDVATIYLVESFQLGPVSSHYDREDPARKFLHAGFRRRCPSEAARKTRGHESPMSDGRLSSLFLKLWGGNFIVHCWSGTATVECGPMWRGLG